MRLSNNIHNVCGLEGAQLIQEWKEEEKIAIKKPAPPPPAPKKEEPKKEGEATAEPPKEGEAPADGEKPAAEGEKKSWGASKGARAASTIATSHWARLWDKGSWKEELRRYQIPD